MNKLRTLTANLSDTQSVFIKPALSCLQVGVGLYLIDVIKPYILPLMLVSLGTIAVIMFQVINESSQIASADTDDLIGCK